MTSQVCTYLRPPRPIFCLSFPSHVLSLSRRPRRGVGAREELAFHQRFGEDDGQQPIRLPHGHLRLLSTCSQGMACIGVEHDAGEVLPMSSLFLFCYFFYSLSIPNFIIGLHIVSAIFFYWEIFRADLGYYFRLFAL